MKKFDIPKLFHKKLMIIIFVVALLLSITIGVQRVWIEYQNKDVELVMGYDELLNIEMLTGNLIEEYFPLLAEAGITSIALEEDTFNNLVKQGRITWVEGKEIINAARMAQIHNYILNRVSRGNYIHAGHNYIIFDDVETYRRAVSALNQEIGTHRVRELGGNIIEVQAGRDELRNIGLGISRRLVRFLQTSGFEVIPRLVNSVRLDEVSLINKIKKINKFKNIRTIIFSGPEVLGYPHHLPLVIAELKKLNINFGFIEFVKQKGAIQTAENMPERTLLVHSISSREMRKMSVPKAVNRYVRSVVERGTRILYIRPKLNIDKNFDLPDINSQYILSIRDRLENLGYRIKQIETPVISKFRRISFIEIFIITLGMLMALCYMIERLKGLSPFAFYTLLGLGILVNIIALLTGHLLALRKLFAALTASLFPAFAIIQSFPKSIDSTLEDKLKIKLAITASLKLIFITFLGSILLSGLLSDPYYMHKIYMFWGVKLTFMIPLFLVGSYYFFNRHKLRHWKYLIKQLFYTPITFGAMFFIGVALVMGGVYLGRSGNFSLPTLALEGNLREWLSNLLFVRPRTKEFLIGFPAFILAFVYIDVLFKRFWIWAWMLMAVIAPISIMNTFAHIHSPLLLSLLRTFNGWWLGVLMALLFWFAIESTRRLWKFFVY